MPPGRIREPLQNVAPAARTQNHWTLAVINFRLERLEYYDSLGSPFGDEGFEVGVGAAMLSRCCRMRRVFAWNYGGRRVFTRKARKRRRETQCHCVFSHGKLEGGVFSLGRTHATEGVHLRFLRFPTWRALFLSPNDVENKGALDSMYNLMIYRRHIPGTRQTISQHAQIMFCRYLVVS